VHVKESVPSNNIATASHRLRITKSPNSPQIGSAFTNSNSAHPIGEDQKILGGDIAWPAAPLKVASAVVLVLVHSCGWPSEIWLTAQMAEVTVEDWVGVLVDTVVRLDVEDVFWEVEVGVVAGALVVGSVEGVVIACDVTALRTELQ
jgi:hypothetical protein